MNYLLAPGTLQCHPRGLWVGHGHPSHEQGSAEPLDRIFFLQVKPPLFRVKCPSSSSDTLPGCPGRVGAGLGAVPWSHGSPGQSLPLNSHQRAPAPFTASCPKTPPSRDIQVWTVTKADLHLCISGWDFSTFLPSPGTDSGAWKILCSGCPGGCAADTDGGTRHRPEFPEAPWTPPVQGLLVLKIGITKLTASLKSTPQNLELKSTKAESCGTPDDNFVFLWICKEQELNQICTQLLFFSNKHKCSHALLLQVLKIDILRSFRAWKRFCKSPMRNSHWVQRWKLQRRFLRVLCKYPGPAAIKQR